MRESCVDAFDILGPNCHDSEWPAGFDPRIEVMTRRDRIDRRQLDIAALKNHVTTMLSERSLLAGDGIDRHQRLGFRDKKSCLEPNTPQLADRPADETHVIQTHHVVMRRSLLRDSNHSSVTSRTPPILDIGESSSTHSDLLSVFQEDYPATADALGLLHMPICDPFAAPDFHPLIR